MVDLIITVCYDTAMHIMKRTRVSMELSLILPGIFVCVFDCARRGAVFLRAIIFALVATGRGRH